MSRQPLMTHRMPIRPRYCECDPMGVEIGRTELLRACGHSYADIEREGAFLAVTRLEVSYRRPARYDESLDLETTLVDVGHVKIEHTYRLLRDGDLLATGTTTLACLDREGRPRALPAALQFHG
jgi:acyl-CoA thioester hydrolase